MPNIKPITCETVLRKFTCGGNTFLLTEGKLLKPSEKREIIARNLYKQYTIADSITSFRPVEQKIYDNTSTRRIIKKATRNF